jgi:hypothetical protein
MDKYVFTARRIVAAPRTGRIGTIAGVGIAVIDKALAVLAVAPFLLAQRISRFSATRPNRFVLVIPSVPTIAVGGQAPMEESVTGALIIASTPKYWNKSIPRCVA